MGTVQSWMEPDIAPPKAEYVPQFDSMTGFPNGRKPREVKTTFEEAEAAAVHPYLRDYCIDEFMEFMRCRAEVFPWNYKCAHQVHAYHQCQFDDHELRMKEYERERRIAEKLGVEHKPLKRYIGDKLQEQL